MTEFPVQVVLSGVDVDEEVVVRVVDALEQAADLSDGAASQGPQVDDAGWPGITIKDRIYVNGREEGF